MVQRIVFGKKSCGTARICYSGNEAIARLPISQNIYVIDLVDGDIVPHTLRTIKLIAFFFDTNNRLVKEIDFEPIDIDNIKVHLPYSDTPDVDKFSGDIFLTKRVNT